MYVIHECYNNNNKFVQSNLGKGPRRGTVAHVRRKVPIGYNGAPQVRTQKYPFPWTDPQTPLPTYDGLLASATHKRVLVAGSSL